VTIAALFALWLGFAGAAPQAQSRGGQVDFGRYHALIIGANDYRKMPKLKSAVNDASAVAETLRRDYGFQIELLLNPQREEILLALDRLRRDLKPNDNLLIYFAGHGMLDRDADQGFWLPVEADPDVQVNWIPVQTVVGGLRAMQAKHIMVVSDSCFSGMLVRGTGAGVRRGGDRSVELKRLAEKRARTVMTSGGLEPVLDAGGQGHSVFTRAFLDVLREADDVIEGQALFSEVRRKVIVNAQQTPEYADIRQAGHDGGDFLFVPLNRARPATSTVGAPQADYEMAFWDAIKNSSNPADYRAYLESFPQGRFAPLARVRSAAGSSATPSPDVEPPLPMPRPQRPRDMTTAAVSPTPNVAASAPASAAPKAAPPAAKPTAAPLPTTAPAPAVARPAPQPVATPPNPPQAAAPAPAPIATAPAPPPAQVAALPPAVAPAAPPPSPIAGEIADANGFKARWGEVRESIRRQYDQRYRMNDMATRAEEMLGYDRLNVQPDRIELRLRYMALQEMGPYPMTRQMTATVVIRNAAPFEIIDFQR